MCGLIALREPVLRVIFMRGAFTADHVLLSSASLVASVSGLVAIMMVRVVVQGFAALEDTKTPVKCSLIAIGSNIIFNLILVFPLDYVGLALSTALAAFVNLSLLIFFLYKKKIYSFSLQTLIFIAKIAISGLIMAVFLRLTSPDFSEWVNMSTIKAATYLTLYIVAGTVVFLATATVLRIKIKQLKK